MKHGDINVPVTQKQIDSASWLLHSRGEELTKKAIRREIRHWASEGLRLGQAAVEKLQADQQEAIERYRAKLEAIEAAKTPEQKEAERMEGINMLNNRWNHVDEG